MKKIKSLFTDSLQELRNLKTVSMAAMLMAVAVVLSFYSLQLTDNIKIDFSTVANQLAGMLFGPVGGSMMGGLADLVKYLVRPTGPFFPGFTFGAVVEGLIYGLALYKRPLNLKRVVAANSIVMLVVNLLMTTYWLTLLYGTPFLAILPARILKEFMMLPVKIILFYTVAKILAKARFFARSGSVAKE